MFTYHQCHFQCQCHFLFWLSFMAMAASCMFVSNLCTYSHVRYVIHLFCCQLFSDMTLNGGSEHCASSILVAVYWRGLECFVSVVWQWVYTCFLRDAKSSVVWLCWVGGLTYTYMIIVEKANRLLDYSAQTICNWQWCCRLSSLLYLRTAVMQRSPPPCPFRFTLT